MCVCVWRMGGGGGGEVANPKHAMVLQFRLVLKFHNKCKKIKSNGEYKRLGHKQLGNCRFRYHLT